MYYVRLFVISELLRSHNSLQLRIKMREKVEVAEQHPIKEDDIIDLHAIEHDKKPYKERRESESVFYPVPYAKSQCSYKHQKRGGRQNPADGMRPAEPLFSLGAEEKNLLSCIKATPLYSRRK